MSRSRRRSDPKPLHTLRYRNLRSGWRVSKCLGTPGGRFRDDSHAPAWYNSSRHAGYLGASPGALLRATPRPDSIGAAHDGGGLELGRPATRRVILASSLQGEPRATHKRRSAGCSARVSARRRAPEADTSASHQADASGDEVPPSLPLGSDFDVVTLLRRAREARSPELP
jgi:hypothetical protein